MANAVLHSSRLLAVLTAALTSACHYDPSPYFPSTTTLFGIVRDAEGRPVAGVSVGASVWNEDCSGAPISDASSFSRPVTDAGGRYTLLMQLPAPVTRCVRVSATGRDRPDTARLVLRGVVFRLDQCDSVPADLRFP